MSVACIALNSKCRLESWNPAAERLFGFTREEAIGKHPYDLIVPREEQSHVGATLLELSNGAANTTCINKNVTKDGHTIVCEWHNTSLIDAGGSFAGAICLGMDITENICANNSMREREELLRFAMGAAKFGVWNWDISKDEIHFSDGIGPLMGLAPGQGPRQVEEVLNAVAPEARKALTEQISNLGETGNPSHPEIRVTWPDGSQHWIKLHTTVLLDAVGKVSRAAGVAIDITQQKNDSDAIEGSLRALRTLSAVNQELVRASTEQEFLQAVCEAVVVKGGYVMAWVGFAEHGNDKSVRPVAQYGFEEGYLSSANITWADTERGQGPTGRAVRTGRIQVNQNVLTNPVMAPWRDSALNRGYESSIGLPLKGEIGTFGALTLYARHPDAFGEREVALLKELAADLAFGIVTLRTKAERDRIAEQNRQYEINLRDGLEETIQAVSAAMAMRDEYTHSHQRRVAALAVAIANEMGISEDSVHGVKVAAIVHDLGKLKVPAEILAKPAKLSELEFRLVQEHAQNGRDILKDITFPWPIADIVWQHHERLDGSGYPRGLKGDAILPGARVLAVADVVEAMASHRPYRAALGMDVALKEIERGSGTIFDPAVADACLRLCREDKFEFPS
jgi:PAS domain S-box-containing protein/putative nucleotidyltransferase with HDIG domain